jgi:hypothetical protein
VVCVDGDRFDEVHNDSIFAWEVPTPGGESFYTAVKPLINAFARHDECLEVDGRTGNCTRRRNAAKIFVDLMSVLHRHWGSPKTSYLGRTFQSKDAKAQRYSAGDDVRSYERITAEALTLSDLVPALVALSPTLNRMTLDGTNKTGPARPALVKTLKYLFDGAVTPPEVAYRDGQTQAKKSDGTPAGRATPYYLLADAFARKRAALAAAVPEQAGAWRSSSTKLVDQMLTIEKAGNGWRMKSRRFHGVHLVLIDFLRERLRVHTAAGDRAKWIHRELTGDITRVLNNPVFAALADLTGKLEAKENDASRRALYDLLGYLVDQARSDKAFQAALTGLADNVQLFLDDPDMVPVSRAIGAAIVPASIDPSKGAVETHLRMMKQAKALDPNCVARGGKECTLVTVIRNLFAETPSGVTPVADLADAIAEVNRNTPGAGGAFRPEDYRDVLGNIEHFLTDEQRGFMRFVRIVKNRRVTPESQ